MQQCGDLYTTLENTAAKFPWKAGISDEEEEITYEQFKCRVDSLAAYLHEEAGIEKGCRVGMLMENGIGFMTAVYAAAKLGVQAVLLNVKLHAAEMAFILQDTDTKILILNAKLWERIAPKIASTPVDTLILDSNTVYEGMEEFRRYFIRRGITYQAKGRISADIGGEDTLAILYTSGTSGTPKGVELRHRAVLETVYSYQEILGLDETQSTLLAVPLFHVTGFSCIMALFVYIGGYLKILPSFHARRALEVLSGSRIRHFHAVPTIYQMLVNAFAPEGITSAPQNAGVWSQAAAGCKGRFDLTALESAVCGGGYIEDRLIGQFTEIAPNVSFHPAYGMTETAGGGVLFPESYLESQKRGAAGQVMKRCEIMILNEEKQCLPVGEIGQIAFRGQMVIDGYMGGQGKDNFQGGWLLSGDLGRLDEEGYVYVVGRMKSMVNRGGEKIYSRFVEKEICLYPKVNQCMVFPVRDSLFGEVPGCVIVPNRTEVIAEGEIREFLEGRIQKTKIPQYIEFWDSLPGTASGKVKLAYLSRLFSDKYAK